MKILQNQFNKRVGAWILVGLVFLLAIGFFNPPVASADGGGFPTRTPTVTRTSAPTLTPTITQTATFTSLPPYPLESSGEVQSVQQEQVASSPTDQPVAQTTESGSSLGGCLPTGILILLAGILLVTFFFVRRTRKKPG
jgi:multidrug efflux pump subunit AcrA (membrane-fusion protein)